MASLKNLSCAGSTYFAGSSNVMDGILYVENSRVFNFQTMYPVNSVYLSSASAKPAILSASGAGTWNSIGSFTIGTTTVYAWKRTA